MRFRKGLIARVAVLSAFAPFAFSQQSLNWEQVRLRFLANNPNLLAGKEAIESSRASEVTANLRPNPEFSLVADEFRVFNPNPLRPFQNTQLTPVISQLFERRDKRGLRTESARLATEGTRSDYRDLERQLTFSLRDAFVKTLQAKSTLELARENLSQYDRVIAVNRERFRAGDISRSDLDRVEFQRSQFESDLVNAQVNLRTAKIAMLSLMNERTPVEQFDVAGDFDFHEKIFVLDELRKQALASRPDLRSAQTAVVKARADNKLAWANGSTDPTLGMEYQRTGPDNTMGLWLSFPIRIFDRNQGEKARTAVEIQRAEHSRQGIEAGILKDVDSAYETVESTRVILRSYRDQYLKQAERIRDTVSFAYSKGGASLLDFLDAQKSYRDTQLNYRNLVGSYLSAVNQLSLAVGEEVMP